MRLDVTVCMRHAYMRLREHPAMHLLMKEYWYAPSAAHASQVIDGLIKVSCRHMCRTTARHELSASKRRSRRSWATLSPHPEKYYIHISSNTTHINTGHSNASLDNFWTRSSNQTEVPIITKKGASDTRGPNGLLTHGMEYMHCSIFGSLVLTDPTLA